MSCYHGRYVEVFNTRCTTMVVRTYQWYMYQFGTMVLEYLLPFGRYSSTIGTYSRVPLVPWYVYVYYVRTYTCIRVPWCTCSMVRTRTMVPMVLYRGMAIRCMSYQMVPWYSSTIWYYICTRVHVPWYCHTFGTRYGIMVYTYTGNSVAAMVYIFRNIRIE